MTESGSQSTLYVSYAGQDVDFAFKLAADLKNAGFNIWIEQVDLNANENHLSVLEYALEHCPVILPILSVNNVATRTIWDDFVQLANEANSRIVPLTLDEANLPAFSQHYSVVDFCSWKNEIQYAESLGSLADIIEADRIRRDSETPDLDTQFINRLVAEIKRYKVLMEIANSPSKGLPSDKRAIYSQSMWGLTGTFEVYTGSSAQAVGSVYEFGEILSKFPKLLLVGARGSGKTTTLYRALLNALRTYQADPSQAPLPLLLPLGAWLDDVRIETFIRDQWTLGGDPIEEIAAGNVIVFLDGLNEVGQPIQNKLDSLQIWLDSDFAPRSFAISSDLSVLTRNIPKLPVVRLKEADIPRIRQYAVNHLERDNAQ
jgi:predicted NACHT family NTPase